MTLKVIAQLVGREITDGENPSATLVYKVLGTNDEWTAKEAIVAASPATFYGLQKQSVTAESVGHLVWDGQAKYAPYKPPEVGESSVSFSTSGGTAHITQSLETVQRKAPPGKTAPNYQGAIGVTGDSIEGVDIVVPQMEMVETHYFDPAAVTLAYMRTLYYTTGKVNADPFRGFAAGEVLFMGADGNKKGDEYWEISFRFSISPNIGGFAVGPISGLSKRGWEYLWVSYQDTEDSEAMAIVKAPQAAYIEKVYQTTSFAVLGIGT